jgi:6-phosphofructokinase 1
MKQRVGIFTGGGTAPGWNAVLASAARYLQKNGHEAVGLPEGWKGLLSVREDIVDLSGMTRRELHDLISTGGSILRSSRTKIEPKDYEQVRTVANAYGLTGIIPIGGDDTLGQARKLQEAGIIKAVGVPKTIDNDVEGTQLTFGFNTACDRTSSVIRRMRVDAKAHSRVAIVETMGRNAGWIALHSGEAGGADITLIPEFPIDEEILLQKIEAAYRAIGTNGRQEKCVVISLSEGYFGEDPNAEKDPFGHGKLSGAADRLEALVKKKLRLGTMKQVVGYETRNGDPVASDVIFASQLGTHAGMLAAADKYGTMAAFLDGKVVTAPLSSVSGGRHVTDEFYDPERLAMRLVPRNVEEAIRGTREAIASIPDTPEVGVSEHA